MCDKEIKANLFSKNISFVNLFFLKRQNTKKLKSSFFFFFC